MLVFIVFIFLVAFNCLYHIFLIFFVILVTFLVLHYCPCNFPSGIIFIVSLFPFVCRRDY